MPSLTPEDHERAMDAFMSTTVSDYERSLPMADYDKTTRFTIAPDPANADKWRVLRVRGRNVPELKEVARNLTRQQAENLSRSLRVSWDEEGETLHSVKGDFHPDAA
jgi:hypothetical protein